MDENITTTTVVTQPVIIDLGSRKSKILKELKKGEGKLWEEVQGVVEMVQDKLGEKTDGKVVIPVVMIYEKKRKRQRLDKLILPYLKGLR